MRDCPCCTKRQTAGSLVRNYKCVKCCADAVIVARPSRKLQEKVLAQLECLNGAPSREKILEAVKVT